MAHFKQERVSDLLHSFLAEEIRRMHDPLLSQVTITDVEVARDIRTAKVFWSLIAAASSGNGNAVEGKNKEALEEQRRADAQAGLEKSEGYLKKRIADELELRYVPQLFFKHDDSAERGLRIEQLLKQVGF